MKKEMICITCPIGCHLELSLEEGGELQVSGNRCPRGQDYAREEYFSPKRTLTATVSIRSELQARLPVRSVRPVPVGDIEELLKVLYTIELKAPVKRGDVILRDFQGTQVDVVASFSLRE